MQIVAGKYIDEKRKKCARGRGIIFHLCKFDGLGFWRRERKYVINIQRRKRFRLNFFLSCEYQFLSFLAKGFCRFCCCCKSQVERETITSLGREEEDEDIVLFPFLFSVHVGYRKYILEMLGGPGERVEFA